MENSCAKCKLSEHSQSSIHNFRHILDSEFKDWICERYEPNELLCVICVAELSKEFKSIEHSPPPTQQSPPIEEQVNIRIY